MKKRTIEETHKSLVRDSLQRIRELRCLLDGIETKVKNGGDGLNTLGEMQGVAVILDCRLASLATVHALLEKG